MAMRLIMMRTVREFEKPDSQVFLSRIKIFSNCSSLKPPEVGNRNEVVRRIRAAVSMLVCTMNMH